MNYIKRAWHLMDDYILARWQKRASTAHFWYLPEPPNIQICYDMVHQKNTSATPFYLMDYREKLHYSLENKDGIIVLAYHQPIGEQINPEAAFQYALGLHDQFFISNQKHYLNKFWHYAHYFLSSQNTDGLWGYEFDWYGSKAPWYSALAQSRGASLMLRAWIHSKNPQFLDAAITALSKFNIPTHQGGFLQQFSLGNCFYFEEYPQTPSGVINGFMATLISLWEIHFWTQDRAIGDLWKMGISSLEIMLPHYSTGWWSLYDLDQHKNIKNVNSPRYHLLEIHYLQILNLLSPSSILQNEYLIRRKQYQHLPSKLRALSLKSIRKIIYK